jgi:hypothetical protein
VAWVLALALGASASAQTRSSGTSTGQSSTTTQTPSSSTDTAQETRPATTTFFGDTGLWFVPTAEVLGHGKWSASGYRRGTNWVQGYTNVADFAGTVAVGIKNRAEIFGSFLVDTRIDRDVRPVFVADPAFGGFINRYPRVNQYWTGDNVGDFYLGFKAALNLKIFLLSWMGKQAEADSALRALREWQPAGLADRLDADRELRTGNYVAANHLIATALERTSNPVNTQASEIARALCAVLLGEERQAAETFQRHPDQPPRFFDHYILLAAQLGDARRGERAGITSKLQEHAVAAARRAVIDVLLQVCGRP